MSVVYEQKYAKETLTYLKSIDKSLGRIATALEKPEYREVVGTDDDGNDILVWHPGYNTHKTIKKED